MTADVPAATTLDDASDPAGVAFTWLSGTYKAVSRDAAGITVPRFGGVKVHIVISDATEPKQFVEVSATILFADPAHPLFREMIAEGRRIFGSEFLVEPGRSTSRLALRRTLQPTRTSEAILVRNVAEVGVAAARLHSVLAPILSPPADE